MAHRPRPRAPRVARSPSASLPFSRDGRDPLDGLDQLLGPAGHEIQLALRVVCCYFAVLLGIPLPPWNRHGSQVAYGFLDTRNAQAYRLERQRIRDAGTVVECDLDRNASRRTRGRCNDRECVAVVALPRLHGRPGDTPFHARDHAAARFLEMIAACDVCAFDRAYAALVLEVRTDRHDRCGDGVAYADRRGVTDVVYVDDQEI